MKPALVGDIGGTQARFGLWLDGQLSAVRVMASADFAGPEEAIELYLSELDMPPGSLSAVCLAGAGPVDDDGLQVTNSSWHLSRVGLRRSLQLEDVLLINDFAAMALGMTRLKDDERLPICPGLPAPNSPVMVIGPGTGLGVGTLLGLNDGRWLALPGEGGHVDLPIGNQREAALWQVLQADLGHVRAEDVLSGRGLLHLYRAICGLDGHSARLQTPAEVTTAALAGEPLAVGVLEQFCCWLGRVAGNCVLTLGARGGVYIVGGVVPHFAAFFQASGFARSFADKGVMSHYFADIPVWLVLADYPGLLGAGVALQQTLTPYSYAAAGRDGRI